MTDLSEVSHAEAAAPKKNKISARDRKSYERIARGIAESFPTENIAEHFGEWLVELQSQMPVWHGFEDGKARDEAQQSAAVLGRTLWAQIEPLLRNHFCPPMENVTTEEDMEKTGGYELLRYAYREQAAVMPFTSFRDEGDRLIWKWWDVKHPGLPETGYDQPDPNQRVGEEYAEKLIDYLADFTDGGLEERCCDLEPLFKSMTFDKETWDVRIGFLSQLGKRLVQAKRCGPLNVDEKQDDVVIDSGHPLVDGVIEQTIENLTAYSAFLSDVQSYDDGDDPGDRLRHGRVLAHYILTDGLEALKRQHQSEK